MLSLAAVEDGVRKIIFIDLSKFSLKPVSSTSHGRDVFAPVAAFLSLGVDPKEFGKRGKMITLGENLMSRGARRWARSWTWTTSETLTNVPSSFLEGALG